MRYHFLLLFTCTSLLSLAQQKPLQYKNIGPSRGGRVTAVCGVTDSTQVYYMGATGGGLWKTTDAGHHWKNISDGYFKSPSIGAIAVDQSDPNTVYAGTGSDGLRSNVIVGKGIYKSIDAGKTWQFSGLENAGQIGAIEIDPSNNQTLLSAVIGQPFRTSKERGVYKSIDGGKTWEQKLFLSDSVGAVDIEFAPKNPNIVYAAIWRGERKPWTIISGDTTGGIFKSKDGGESWKRISKGLPQGLIGKIDFAVSEAQPSWVWALVQAPTEKEGLYKSEDYGETWQHITMPEKVQESIMYRPFYFTNLDANPKDANQLWSGTKLFWTTKDGGKTWNKLPAYSHADHHDMWINPNNPQLMVAGNDGGASVSMDGGKNWTNLFNQSTAELYSCYVDDQYPYYLYSGQQDNSTIRVPSRQPRGDVLSSNDGHGLSQLQYWESVGGCETGPVIPKPGDPNTVYANCKGQFGVYHHLTGFQQNYYVGAESLYGNHPDDITYRFQRVVPMAVSPFDPNTVYYGSQFVHKTSDGGVTWQTISPDLTANKPAYRMRSGGPIDEDISGEEYYNVLYAIAPSPLEEHTIWAGSNDGLVHITQDGGQIWKNVTPKNLPEDGRVSKIHASNHNAGKAYLVVYRDYLGDDAPYLYTTSDYGENWVLATKGIPDDYPVRVVREDSEREGLLFAGTEFGMFLSFDDGASWQPFQENLPIVPITDMAIFRDNLNLSTLGRSFWIMEDMSVLREFQPADTTKLHVFQPSKTIGENVNLYFTSGKTTKNTTIEFIFKNDENTLIHQKIDTLKNFKTNTWGVQKTTWDLRHYLKRKGEKDFKGPRVAPGNYTAEITIGGSTFKKQIEVLLHPELQEIGTTIADLKEQESLSVKTAQLLIAVQTERMQLEEALKTETSKRKKEQLKKKLAFLIKGKERYDQPKLENHIAYLYRMIVSVPQKLGKDAFERHEALNARFQQLKTQKKL
ncbi:sialidase family protein [Flagellimonas sp. CMM7]|uniref:WD40/YVTN/BNR-like repeat-containing protein n=1 Tax=Flagellimonas sp. CMM7 TaxID=2654676 RepID=UPI0013D0B9CC|nr:sialidase family protein [Flagellimonas sp. CMM7]UII80349.1 hypothetical protein LV704_02270 [Flagellimonas sp. CMM7]